MSEKLKKPTVTRDVCLTWDKPMTSRQAKRYLMTKGFVAEELYDAIQIKLLRKKTVTLAEITELSARLRDTSRQTLYETKLRRWLESKGVEIVKK